MKTTDLRTEICLSKPHYRNAPFYPVQIRKRLQTRSSIYFCRGNTLYTNASRVNLAAYSIRKTKASRRDRPKLHNKNQDKCNMANPHFLLSGTNRRQSGSFKKRKKKRQLQLDREIVPWWKSLPLRRASVADQQFTVQRVSVGATSGVVVVSCRMGVTYPAAADGASQAASLVERA